MNREEILQAIKELSHSQGFYGRLLNNLMNNDEALDFLENQQFTNVVDMVLFFEC